MSFSRLLMLICLLSLVACGSADLMTPLEAVKSGPFVVGAANYTTGSSGAPSATRFNTPVATHYDGMRLYVVDQINNRVLIWKRFPFTNGIAADLVLGQDSLATGYSGTGVTQMRVPTGVMEARGKLFVSDSSNHRILVWNRVPLVNGSAADFVLGKTLWPNRSSVGHPASVSSDGTRLLVTDTFSHRVLIWNSLPTGKNHLPDVVVGQDHFSDGGVCAVAGMNTLCEPNDAKIINGKLVVADTLNHRVLIWNAVPTTNGAAADVVLGQKMFGVTRSSMNHPAGLAGDGNHLYVADNYNNRILVWNSFPTRNAQPPDAVFGQTAFGLGDYQAPTEKTVGGPKGLFIAAGLLLVADSGNNRVLGLALPLASLTLFH